MKPLIKDKSTSNIIDQVVRDVSKSPHTLGVFLFGESKSQPVGEDSLGFLVVSDSRSSSKRTMQIEGVVVDIWTYSYDELIERIVFERDVVLVRVLMKGRVLCQNSDRIKSLRKRAKQVFVQGPKPLTRRQQEFIRLKLTRMYVDARNALRTQKFPEDSFYIMSKNLSEIVTSYFRINRWWPPSERYLLRELRARSLKVYHLVHTFLHHQDPAYRLAAYAKMIECVLEPLGGPSTGYRSREKWHKNRINMLMNPIFLFEALYRNIVGKPLSLASRFDAVARFMKFLKPYKLYFIEITIFGLFMTIISLPIPFLSQYLFDSVLPHRNFQALYFVAIVTAGLGIFRSVIGFFQGYYINYTTEQMNYDITFMFYRHLYDLSHSFYDERETGEIVFRFQDALSALAGSVGIVLRLLQNGVALFIIPIVALFLRWDLALISALFIPINALAYYLESHFVRKYTQQVTAKRAEFTAKNYESLAGIRTVISLNARDRVMRLLRRLYLQLRERIMKLSTIILGIDSFIGVVNVVLTTGFMLYAWAQILEGTLTVGDLIAFGMLAGLVFSPIRSLISLGPEIQQTMVRAERFFEIYDIKPDIVEEDEAEEYIFSRGEIEFDRVSFEYELGQETLKEISVRIHAGQTVAVVGGSGCGKTTFVSLIPRFYDPTAGTIRIDGKDIKRIKLYTLRSQIGFIPQEDIIFAGTITDNLRIVKPGVREPEIKEALRRAGLGGLIERLPEGLETWLGEGGAQLSGGEKKRLSLARIILKDPKILIFDETFSQIDPLQEEAILANMREVMKGKTIIVIAHRLSTIRAADLILYFEDGEIVEQGTHRDLFREGKRYYRFFQGHRFSSDGRDGPE